MHRSRSSVSSGNNPTTTNTFNKTLPSLLPLRPPTATSKSKGKIDNLNPHHHYFHNKNLKPGAFSSTAFPAPSSCSINNYHSNTHHGPSVEETQISYNERRKYQSLSSTNLSNQHTQQGNFQRKKENQSSSTYIIDTESDHNKEDDKEYEKEKYEEFIIQSLKNIKEFKYNCPIREDGEEEEYEKGLTSIKKMIEDRNRIKGAAKKLKYTIDNGHDDYEYDVDEQANEEIKENISPNIITNNNRSIISSNIKHCNAIKNSTSEIQSSFKNNKLTKGKLTNTAKNEDLPLQQQHKKRQETTINVSANNKKRLNNNNNHSNKEVELTKRFNTKQNQAELALVQKENQHLLKELAEVKEKLEEVSYENKTKEEYIKELEKQLQETHKTAEKLSQEFKNKHDLMFMENKEYEKSMKELIYWLVRMFEKTNKFYAASKGQVNLLEEYHEQLIKIELAKAFHYIENYVERLGIKEDLERMIKNEHNNSENRKKQSKENKSKSHEQAHDQAHEQEHEEEETRIKSEFFKISEEQRLEAIEYCDRKAKLLEKEKLEREKKNKEFQDTDEYHQSFPTNKRQHTQPAADPTFNSMFTEEEASFDNNHEYVFCEEDDDKGRDDEIPLSFEPEKIHEKEENEERENIANKKVINSSNSTISNNPKVTSETTTNELTLPCHSSSNKKLLDTFNLNQFGLMIVEDDENDVDEKDRERDESYEKGTKEYRKIVERENEEQRKKEKDKDDRFELISKRLFSDGDSECDGDDGSASRYDNDQSFSEVRQLDHDYKMESLHHKPTKTNFESESEQEHSMVSMETPRLSQYEFYEKDPNIQGPYQQQNQMSCHDENESSLEQQGQNHRNNIKYEHQSNKNNIEITEFPPLQQSHNEQHEQQQQSEHWPVVPDEKTSYELNKQNSKKTETELKPEQIIKAKRYCHSEMDNYLELIEGDEVKLLRQVKEGVWIGEHGEKIGFIKEEVFK